MATCAANTPPCECWAAIPSRRDILHMLQWFPHRKWPVEMQRLWKWGLLFFRLYPESPSEHCCGACAREMGGLYDPEMRINFSHHRFSAVKNRLTFYVFSPSFFIFRKKGVGRAIFKFCNAQHKVLCCLLSKEIWPSTHLILQISIEFYL